MTQPWTKFWRKKTQILDQVLTLQHIYIYILQCPFPYLCFLDTRRSSARRCSHRRYFTEYVRWAFVGQAFRSEYHFCSQTQGKRLEPWKKRNSLWTPSEPLEPKLSPLQYWTLEEVATSALVFSMLLVPCDSHGSSCRVWATQQHDDTQDWHGHGIRSPSVNGAFHDAFSDLGERSYQLSISHRGSDTSMASAEKRTKVRQIYPRNRKTYMHLFLFSELISPKLTLI